MNLHEYQGKQLLEKFNVSIQKGYVANTPEEAVEFAKILSNETGTNIFVIKAQIHNNWKCCSKSIMSINL